MNPGRSLRRFLGIALVFAGVGAGAGAGRPAAAQSASGGASQRQAAPSAGNAKSLTAIEQEDDNDIYRHSPSVRAVGRLLHLDQEQAARSFEYLNFGLLALGILYFVVRKMPSVFRERSDSIQKQLTEARNMTAEANERLRSIERKFSGLEQEIAALRAQAEQEGKAEEERAKRSMEAERQRIIKSAEQEIAAAAAAGKRDLRHYAAQVSLERASQLIHLGDKDDRFLVRQLIESSSSPNVAAANGERH